MKNIILQHYTGTLGRIEKLSIANIKTYADTIGVEYRFLDGNVWSENYRPAFQKLYMLDEEFDSYDEVLMLDIDMFVTRNNYKNVFKEESGIGLHMEIEKGLRNRIANLYPDIASNNHPYWSGAFYKMNLNLRKTFRECLNDSMKWIDVYKQKKFYGDEGVMHGLAKMTNLSEEGAYIDRDWCFGSYFSGIEDAKIVHLRPKPTGSKNKNYDDLHMRGIIKS